MFACHGLELMFVIAFFFRFHARILSTHGFVHDFLCSDLFLIGMYIHIRIIF